jgi:hypothetical protein
MESNMRGSFPRELLPAVLGLLLAHPIAHAQTSSESGGRPTLRAGTLTADLVLDGRMNDAAWQSATDSISNLVMIEPEEGGVPAGRTVVKVLADRDAVLVGIRCEDAEPDRIVSFSKARDADLTTEDHVVIVLDTFLDGRSGYVFAVNPAGARSDGLVFARGEEVNNAWDTIWEARTWRDASGWSAEIRVPVTSLSFRKDATPRWGFNVQRRVQRLQETSRWSAANLDYEIFQTSHAGLLVDLPSFDQGAGLSIRPAGVGRSGRVTGEDTEFEGDLSLDVTQQIGPSLSSALTVNTDFAETEVDVRQINLTRFPAFFPEKRSFFLAGADIFEFGLGLDEENLLPFHTRRIGLFGLDEDEQSAIAINVGGKVTGRIGRTHVGGLAVNTRESNRLPVGDEGLTIDVPQTTMGAVRVKQDVLEESSLGVLATFGDQLGRSQAWTAGLDFTYQTSSFMGEQNFLVGLWGLLNDREDLSGDKSAWAARLDFPNDLLDMNLTSMRIGDGFDPSLGFMPRNDVHIWDFGGEFNPRPPWPFIHQMFHELSFTLFNNRSNSRWESYAVTIKPIGWLLASGDQFEVGLEPEGDRPANEFEVTDDVDIAPGSYEFTRWVLGAQTATKRRVSATAFWELGNFYNGKLNTLTATVAFKPSSFLTVELLGERSQGRIRGPEDGSVELFEKPFKEAVYGVRWELNVSPDLQASNLTQYDTNSRELGYNTRVRWTFSPSGDLFVVYNHNAFRTVDKRWGFTSNQVPVKLQYTWRF